MTDVEILRMAAFTEDPTGGNPAGVVLDAGALTDAEMLAIAADVDYSETAFVMSDDGHGLVVLRFFSPYAEVPFCGHATLATAVALASRASEPEQSFAFETPSGEVAVRTRRRASGIVEASFTSIDPVVGDLDPVVLDRLLGLLSVDGRRVERADLAADYPPRVADTGNPHPILVFADRAVFDAMTFDAAGMRALMDQEGWTGTVTLLLPDEEPDDKGHEPDGESVRFEARNPFPVGRIIEDPATGSAAAATGAYLRDLGAVQPPARVTIRQGRHVGRPGVLTVDVPPAGGITVSGTAVELRQPVRAARTSS
jgi:PhzF family phenazine biosynthesis protein